jgi:hypothetical protein
MDNFKFQSSFFRYELLLESKYRFEWLKKGLWIEIGLESLGIGCIKTLGSKLS